MIEVRWHGRGGQGGFTAARLLGMAVAQYDEYYAQAFPSFGPERRGAPVLGFTRIDTKPIHDHSKVYTCDYVVVLDETLLDTVPVTDGLKEDGWILINSQKNEQEFSYLGARHIKTVDATGIALDILGQPITNTAMFGALVAVSHIVSLDAALESISLSMAPRLVSKNQSVVKKTYELLK